MKPITRHPLALLIVTLSILITACGGKEVPEAPSSPSLAFDLMDESRGPLIVFIHGWMCDRTYWKSQVEYFASSYPILNVDLMEHGDSPTDPRASISEVAADVVPLIEKINPKEVVLVGHSMGGPVVVEIARALSGPDSILIVGVDTLRQPNEVTDQDRLEQTLAAMDANFEQTTVGFVSNAFFLPDTNPEFVANIANDMAQGPMETGMRLVKALTDYDTAAGLTAVSQHPLLLINASYIPTDVAGLKAINPAAKVLEVDGVGHFLHMEREQEFNALLEKEISNWQESSTQ
ncbi:MAG: alpha/beta hydrolase [Pseudomonadota bacterium]